MGKAASFSHSQKGHKILPIHLHSSGANRHYAPDIAGHPDVRALSHNDDDSRGPVHSHLRRHRELPLPLWLSSSDVAVDSNRLPQLSPKVRSGETFFFANNSSSRFFPGSGGVEPSDGLVSPSLLLQRGIILDQLSVKAISGLRQRASLHFQDLDGR